MSSKSFTPNRASYPTASSVGEMLDELILLTERFPKFGCEGINQRESVCDADAESLSQSDIWPH